MKLDRFDKVAQQIVGVAQVPVGSALRRSVPELFDQAQVHPEDITIVQFHQIQKIKQSYMEQGSRKCRISLQNLDASIKEAACSFPDIA